MKVTILTRLACTLIPAMLLSLPAFSQNKPAQNSNDPSASMNLSVKYPQTRQDASVSDNYHGTSVKDPYRWLEDDNSAETKAWVAEQNTVTQGLLQTIPYRGTIKSRLEQIWNFEKFGVPFKEGAKFYFFKNDGLQNQSVLYAQDNLEAPATVVLDPNTFSADGTTSLGELGFSQDGRYLAYSISEGGSDWRTIQIKDLKTGKMLEEKLEWAKFTGISWAGDGFFYSRYPEPAAGMELTASNQNSAVYFHRIGTAQSADQQIFADPEHPNYYFGSGTTDDERFLFISAGESTYGNSLYVRDLSRKENFFTPLVQDFKNEHNVIDNLEGNLLLMTDYKAARQRIVLVRLGASDKDSWQTVVPEHETDVLQSAALVNGKLLCVYLHNAASAIRIFSVPDGKLLNEVNLPEIGTVGSVSGKKGDRFAFFSFQSFLRPSSIFVLDMDTYKSSVFKQPKVSFRPEDYITEQVWVTSKDGTKVPVFLTHRKDMAKNSQNPTLLYGYGGFNISLTPTFSASRAVLLEQGGVYAVANLRGGGEFGETWHKAGTKCQKQNVFDDFIAAAEYLVKEKITSPAKLAIEGGSNGGLLVGAAMTQRPDLFGVAFPRVGVLDMLRYHQFTIGYAWAIDYGRSDNADEFKCLYAYSPLHNLKKANYPATMITTADHDDRVVPAHSFKFAAALQANQQGSKPTVIRIETSAGHGAGKPTSKLLEESADMLSFMFANMGVIMR